MGAKQATNQAVRFPVQFYTKQLMTGGDKSLEAHPLYNGAAGAVAGAVSVLCTMPQDTVKTRMQGEEAKKLYKGTVDCAMQMLKQEGPASFFSGAIPRMVQVGMTSGISFALFPVISQLLNKVM